jgi:acyl-CoA hydrolase
LGYDREYDDLLRTAEEAVGLIEPGDDIVAGMTAGEPESLMRALGGHSFSDNRLYVMLPTHELPVDVDREKLQIVSLYLGPIDRKGFAEGRIDLLPNHFSQLPGLLSRITRERVVMATVSPMDDEGYFSFGVNCDYTAPVVEDAKTVLLEVNENMPRTFGKNRIHISEAKEKKLALVENNADIPELPTPEPSEADKKIADTVAGTIQNGDVLQVGFGSIPGAVLNRLTDHEDLGMFSEALHENVVDLYEAGAITNANNPFNEGKSTATFMMGTRKLYDFVHENPDIYMCPVNETNDPGVLARIDNIVSINATVEVDFLGQCASEQIAGKYYSSTGGQSDFSRGARLAKHGKGFVCLHSSARDDTVSTIVPTLGPGTAVSTHKNNTDIVVTEYGVAELRGKTIRERTHALIDIAHPNFRDELKSEAKEMGYW